MTRAAEELVNGPESTRNSLHRIGDAIEGLFKVHSDLNEKGEPDDSDAAGWKEDFRQLWEGLQRVVELLPRS